MIAMLDTSEDLSACESEIGERVEQLFTPLTRFSPQRPDEPFAIDNGAFAGFRAKAFLSLLEREEPRMELCRFVTVPDVVGSARRTLEVFEHWWPKLHRWPLAMVAQDGIADLPIPWGKLDAVFIGGTTEFKMGKATEHVIAAANAMGKWVHVGRVNTPARWEHFEELGADSIDGSGLARYSHMRRSIHDRHMQPPLFAGDGSATSPADLAPPEQVP